MKYAGGAVALALLFASFVHAQMPIVEMPAAPMETDDPTPEAAAGPSVSSVRVVDITDTTARVEVNSDELVQGYVEYGTTEAYGMSTPLSSEFSASPSFLLEGLTPSTTYHYRAVIMDSSGNAALTADSTFATLAPPAEPEPEAPQNTSGETETEETTATEAEAAPATTTTATPTASTTPVAPPPTTTTTHAPPPTTAQPKPAAPPKAAVPAAPATQELGIGLPVAAGQPVLVRVTPGNGRVSFMWKKDLGGKNGTIRTLVIKKEGTYPVVSRIDGIVVYDGPSTSFTDTGLINGTEYHYALYSYGKYDRFTPASRFKVIPRAKMQPAKQDTNKKLVEVADESEPPLTLARRLFYGTRGDDVLALQVHLAQHGYYPEVLITGYFGTLTQKAVSRYQKLNSITPAAGFVGPLTQEALAR